MIQKLIMIISTTGARLQTTLPSPTTTTNLTKTSIKATMLLLTLTIDSRNDFLEAAFPGVALTYMRYINVGCA